MFVSRGIEVSEAYNYSAKYHVLYRNFSLMEPKHLQRRCAELVLYPTLMNRTREEIDGVVGLDRLVEESDFSKLPYLQAIVKETFRLHQSPLGLPRESTAPGEALGYKIPTKTRIIFNIHAIHRDPAVYDNPDEFHPDRFLREHVHVNHMSAFDSYELIPFGVGRRMCPA